ncbi:UPF0565 protein C2orf69 homolog isoform X2 [Nilaparvata lugens]|nr:UPF0565 protein C2orf69 homolog isoform X2 [Nilaparvata lugens]XP_039291779.1 UPF0565 protein C2orf69 homolog isoform X2 [Nilaparvata lugens]
MYRMYQCKYFSKRLLRSLLGYKLLSCNSKSTVRYYAKMAESSPNHSTPTRLLQVEGYDGRKNDVIYHKPSITQPVHSTVIYFGGDVQDFKENMEVHSRPFLKWNLDDMSRMLSLKFPESHIIVVRPSRMDFDVYSCFVNFVPSVKYGVPKHVPMNFAFQHILKLLDGVSQRFNFTNSKEYTHTVDSDLPCRKLIVIGFSKGCVVLNQLLYEFHHIKTSTSPEDNEMRRCIPQISDMFWLDAGHGGTDIFLSTSSVLQTLAESGIRIHIHVTPYQVKDAKRPWIGEEESQFTALLEKLNANVERTLHFGNEAGSLNLHFDVLSAFRMPSGLQFEPD